ncbi:MAG TPA: histidine phosphatase family protein [Jatrophihabitantaceae bacterium]|nr:histidine phosphatase family protein [Jatrophihabitantaceae bacterium]
MIRHGETPWSRSGQHTGRTDIPLTEFGERQAFALRERLGHLRPALVLSSPRSRALETARLAGLTPEIVDADLGEWDYGDYEGLTTTEIRRTVPGWSIWTHPTPGGETADEVGARVDRVLELARRGLADGPVVVFSHGHLSRVIGARWIGLSPLDGRRFTLGTAAACVLSAERGSPVISHWNIPNPARRDPQEDA